MKKLIKNAILINEGLKFRGSLVISGERIEKIIRGDLPAEMDEREIKVYHAEGLYLIPGAIDDQVHFREPGLTHKGDIFTESRAAVAGGVTSFMEMPNTSPPATTQKLLEEKYERAAQVSAANYSFLIGATNDNLGEVLKTDPAKVCGIKVFLGSSTGTLLVDNSQTLEILFKNAPLLIAAHCEDDAIIRKNMEWARSLYGEEVPSRLHPLIRSEEACYRSTASAVDLAIRTGARLHVFHLSTSREMELFHPGNVKDKLVTAEVCVHHLWFDDRDYEKLGSRIKWNPAIKTARDREALWKALLDDRLDVVATDHAPHTLEEKNNSYWKAPSGGPLVQHSLVAMFEAGRQNRISPERIVEKMSHAPADLFRIRDRGYLREGYFADLVLIDPEKSWTVSQDNILYKCGWSPFEGYTFSHAVTHTFVNGELAYHNGLINPEVRGKRLLFDR